MSYFQFYRRWNRDEAVLNAITTKNIDHGFHLSICVAALEILMIFSILLVHTPFDNKPVSIGYYFLMYVILLFVNLALMALLAKPRKKKKLTMKQRKYYDRVLTIYITIHILWGIALAWMDQVNFQNILAFIVNCVVVLTIFIIPPKQMLLISGLSIPALFAGLFFTQIDNNILLGNFTNLFILFICLTFGNHLRLTMFCTNEVYKKQALKLSQIDSLTGLYNRRSLQLYTQKNYSKNADTPTILNAMMIDIDYFKNYNDDYGHLAGDEVLRVVGHILKDLSKQEKLYPVRYGGEEFLLLALGKSPGEIFQIAQTIQTLLTEQRFKTDGFISTNVTVSIGIYSAPVKNQNELLDCIRMADDALYRAKEAGRNCIEY